MDQWTALSMLAPFVAVVALLLVSMWVLFRWQKATHEAALMLQAVLTGGAVLVAGYWYLVERRGAPHADLSQSVRWLGATKQSALIESQLALKNTGSVLVRVTELDVRLLDTKLTKEKARELDDLSPTEWPESFSDGKRMFVGTELQFRPVKWFRGPVLHEIEPGETDTLSATFAVPCTVRNGKITFEVRKGGREELWWKASSLFALDTKCRLIQGVSE